MNARGLKCSISKIAQMKAFDYSLLTLNRLEFTYFISKQFNSSIFLYR